VPGAPIRLGYDGEGVYISRLNRFTVKIDTGGSIVECHLHDTGRIDHLAVPGETRVLYRLAAGSLHRRTRCDVVAFAAGGGVVIADSRVPNLIFREWHGIVAPWAERVEAEKSVMGSRFDFVLTGRGVMGVAEVKGVNKAVNGYGLFPNAPSSRARRHLETLARIAGAGVKALLVFVALRSDVNVFGPDAPVDRAFARLLCAYRRRIEYRGLVPAVTVDRGSREVIVGGVREAPVDACLEGLPPASRGKD